MSISFVYPQYLWLLLIVLFMAGIGLASKRSTSKFRFWGTLGIRTLILCCLILALASIQLKLASDLLTTIFVLDVSDSLSAEAQASGIDFIRRSLQVMSVNDQSGIVMFGEDALVERLASQEKSLADVTSIPLTTRSNIAEALQLAQALFPEEGAKRIVLLSDGRENLGKAVEQAEILAANNIELTYHPLGDTPTTAEVWIESVESPSSVRQGEKIILKSQLRSTSRVNASLRLFSDSKLIQTREILLSPGNTQLQLEVLQDELETGGSDVLGLRRFRLQVVPEADTRLQNNEAFTFTVVRGPPNILIIEGQPGDSTNLVQAIKATEMMVQIATPENMPISLSELADYQAVVLVDVPAKSLPVGVMNVLQAYVRDLGMGLIMVGGSDSFGAGGYLRSPLEETLPVSMDIKNREYKANLALVLAVDKSGSMGRCHCDNPNLNQSYTRAEAGQPKVDIAKEAVMRAASALGEADYLGVVAFDENAHWALRVAPLTDPLSIESAIGPIIAEGSTNIGSGVVAAYNALEGITAQRKHIILLTDGWVRQGDLTGIATEMQGKGITLSVIAAGEGSAEYLEALAGFGGGRYYPATTMLNVPEIFLKETIESAGEYVIEEPFVPIVAVPSPILIGIDTRNFPPLLGYNGTSSKNTARLDLITPRGDPLLATWQYGLGRSAVWTSDLKGQWAKDWIGWSGFTTFASQLVNWVLPAPKYEGLEAQVSLQENQAVIELAAVDQAGLPLNYLDVQATIVNPNLTSEKLSLNQNGAGKYQITKTVSGPGTYLIRLGVNLEDQSLGQLTLGLVVPYSPEYKASGVNFPLLENLAHTTGGEKLLAPEKSFIHNLPSTESARQFWYPLLLVVALLFPMEIALRRLNLGQKELRKLGEWIKSHKTRLDDEHQPRSSLMISLFQARQRARTRSTSYKATQTQPSQPTPRPDAYSEKPDPSPVLEDPGEGMAIDHLKRLQEAKNRARKMKN